MRPWEVVVEAERLARSSPEVVYAHLAELPPRDGPTGEENLPPAMTEALLSRGHPLVDLGLARYASDWDRLKPLWDRGPACRLAILGNRNGGWVAAIDHLDDVYAHGSGDELEAILTNPSLGSGWLEAAISNKLKLPDTRWRDAADLALRNERLTRTVQHETWAEFTDAYEHERPIQAVWRLFEQVETTPEWASVLQRTKRVHFSLHLPKAYLPDLSTDEGRAEWNSTALERHRRYEDDLLSLVSERWRPPQDGDDPMKPYYWAREAFATAAARHDTRLANVLKEHADPAFRRGFYAGGTVYSWPVADFFERDRMEFIEAIISNPTLFERRNSRVQSEVRRLAYDRERADDYRVNWFKHSLQHLQEQDPVKYGGEPTPDMLDAERRAEERETARLDEISDYTRHAQEKTQPLPPVRRFGWFAVVALVVVLLALWRCTRG